MKKNLVALILMAALLLSTVQAVAVQQPILPLSAASALLMEKESGQVLYEQNSQEQMEPASVTKIMTLLLIMEALQEQRIHKEDMVTISAHAAGMGGSQVYLEQGEQMSVHELVKCITVVSGNDAAVAMAEYLAGSEEVFVEQMNQRALELGMVNTHFVNCTGLPVEGHVTTAYDIALMSRELILHHPEIQEYTTIWMDSIRNGAFGLTNTNRLIHSYQGATGLKTGSTDSALYCMSATAERDGMELIAVIMKAPTSADRFQDAQKLLDYGFASYRLQEVYPDQPFAPIPVHLGTQDYIQPQLEKTCKVLIKNGQEESVTKTVTVQNEVSAPIAQGESIGTFQVYIDGILYEEIPIVSTQSVDKITIFGIYLSLLQQLLLCGNNSYN